MQIDIELALVDALTQQINDIQKNLPAEFYVEDRSNKGWGLVVRTEQKLPSDIDDAIDVFLKSLYQLEEATRDNKRLLRVGIYYDTVNCTLLLESWNRLAKFKLALEISTYPFLNE